MAEFASEAEAKAALSYPKYRAWRTEQLGRPFPKKLGRPPKRKPVPGTVDALDPELG